MVHANRFCPPKALDEEEEAFLAEKEVERKLGEKAQKQADKEAQIEYKMAVAQQSGKNDDRVDLAKLMGAVRVHSPRVCRIANTFKFAFSFSTRGCSCANWSPTALRGKNVITSMPTHPISIPSFRCMLQSKSKKPAENSQSKILSRMVAVKRKGSVMPACPTS